MIALKVMNPTGGCFEQDDKQYCSESTLFVALSQLYITICRTGYTICFTSNHRSENHKLFSELKGFVFQETYSKRK